MKSRLEIEQLLSLEIASALEANIRKTGAASLLVSGGSTPVTMFQLLSKFEIKWEKVTITLVDERMVSKNHADSNEKLVHENLLQAYAKKAQFIPLVIDESNAALNLEAVRKLTAKIQQPFTVVVLGMGGDGHTASLFPESPQLAEGMNLQTEENLILTEPVTAPYQRISFTRKALLNTDHLFLHCYGSEKKEILAEAKKQKEFSQYPISGFIHQDIVKLEVFWTN